MLSKVSFLSVALLALGGTGVAAASDYDEGQWVTTFMAGSQLTTHGTIMPQVHGSVGAIDSRLDRLQGNDAFRSGPSFSAEAGYMSESNLEPFVRLTYAQMQGRNTTIGAVAVPALNSATAIGANFDDMKSWSLNLGARYFIADTGTIRPYVAGYVGAVRTDALTANVAINGTPVTHEEFLPRATRFDAGVEGGVDWALSSNADLGLSIGAQYLDARRRETGAFAPIGIEQVGFSDPHWSIPVNLALNYRF